MTLANDKAVDAQLDALGKLVGIADSPLANAVWEMQGAYIRATAARIGDRHGWLEWWTMEAEYGEACKASRGDRRLSATVDGVNHHPATIKGLVWLLVASGVEVEG